MITNKRISIQTCTCLAAAILLLFAVSCSKKSDSEISVGGGTLCVDTPKFALCTSAPCQVDPSDPNSSICDCVVESGANWGKTTCKERMPKGAELHSNFSPLQAGAPLNLKALVCDNKRWAACLDAPCTSDPNDPTKAKCKCPITTTAPWLTFGGKCDPSACNQLWSAGHVVDEDIKKMLAAFGNLKVPGADYPMCSGEGKTGFLCNQKYAFCGNGACPAVEGQPGKALCTCEVLDGYSWGTTTCEQRKPTEKTVISTFAISPSNPLVECPAGGQVVLCLDAKCTMEGPTTAKCMCTSQKATTPYISGGGNCDTSNCSKQMLSGAPVGPAREIANDFSQALMAVGQTPGKLPMCKSQP